MAAYKVLITDRRHASIEGEKSVLEPLGVEVVDKFSATEDELIANGKGAIGMLVSYAKNHPAGHGSAPGIEDSGQVRRRLRQSGHESREGSRRFIRSTCPTTASRK